jgi:Flp pilus assembly protein TadG
MAPRKLQRGVAAVEFGILIIPLTLMLFGLSEYGRAIYQYNTLVKATRDAARYLTTVAPGSGWDQARCLARYGNTACNGAVLAPGLDEGVAVVDICDATNSTKCPGVPHALVPTGSGAVNLVTVTIRGYQFQSLINFPMGDLSAGAPDITFGDISNTMRQAL